MKALERRHPAFLFAYFLTVLLFTMFTVQPVLLALSLCGALAFCAVRQRAKDFFKDLAFYCALFVLIALFNPLFSHNGKTPLFFLNGNAVTLEAVACGADIAAVVVSSLYWFKCYHFVMTGEKFLYLFGKVAPKVSVLLSAALNFVPRFKRQYAETANAQRASGYFASKSLVDRVKNNAKVFAAVLAWSLEKAVETGDAMRARGFGLKGRKSCGIYKMTARDVALLVFVALCAAALTVFYALRTAAFAFYPTFTPLSFTPAAVAMYAVFAALCFLPVCIEGKEFAVWKYLTSKI